MSRVALTASLVAVAGLTIADDATPAAPAFTAAQLAAKDVTGYVLPFAAQNPPSQ